MPTVRPGFPLLLRHSTSTQIRVLREALLAALEDLPVVFDEQAVVLEFPPLTSATLVSSFRQLPLLPTLALVAVDPRFCHPVFMLQGLVLLVADSMDLQ